MKNKTDLTQTTYERPASLLRHIPEAITMSLTCHTIANAECTGVFIQEKYEAYSYRYNVPNSKVYRYGIMGDYHLFIRSGDKVYMEVKGVGDIVISFAELQQNKYWRYYYELSLLLAKDKHKVIKNEAFNKAYDEIYEETKKRVWSVETSYFDYIKQTYNKIYKIIPSGNVCYYKINPTDVEKMEYKSHQGLEVFRMIYMARKDVRLGYFLNKSVIYKNIATEYVMNENKKHILNLAILNSKYCMNDDILTKIYNNISVGGKYEYLTSKEESKRTTIRKVSSV
jgi:hypothetical protein